MQLFSFSNKYIATSYYKTNIKFQEKFNIMRIYRSNDSQHIKKCNFTIPITINETHVVKFTHTPVEAWPQHAAFHSVWFSPLIWSNLIFCPLHKEMSGWMARALMLTYFFTRCIHSKNWFCYPWYHQIKAKTKIFFNYLMFSPLKIRIWMQITVTFI